MENYKGPERRTVITFTREDGERLVRLEEKITENTNKLDTVIGHLAETNKALAGQSVRLNKLEQFKSWVTGIGTTLIFLITCVLGFFGVHAKGHE